MVSRTEINYRYSEYLDVFDQVNFLAVGDDDVSRPTKRSIQDDDFDVTFRDVSVNNSDEYLIEEGSGRAGIRYLSPDILAWLPIKLTEILQVNISKDHSSYWWFTHDFARAYSEKNKFFPEGLIENLELLIRLVLSEPLTWHTGKTRKANEILHQTGTLATYLAYPTLEGFVKFACRRDIQLDGQIKDGRKIRKLAPPDIREYQHHDDGRGICSNIGMLLWHLETEVVKPEHQIHLRDMRESVGEMFDHPQDEIYDLLNSFRNDSLHGRNQAPREHGVLLNYICLIVWISLLP